MEFKLRDIVLSNDITGNSVKDTIKEIIDINHYDDEKALDYGGWDRKPIQLFINSFGGSVYDGLALIDIMKQSKAPVHTVCVGSCMSMGFWVWLSGAKRLIGENATLMYHDISIWAWDKLEGVKQEVKEAERLQKMHINAITSTSSVTKDILQDYITRKAEWYIPPEEALRLKLADDFYTK